MHVIVIGAGPSGLAVSLGLSSLGCTVDLLEKHTNFDVRGSTLGLARNGSKALHEVCPNEDVNTLTDLGIFIPQSGGSMLAWWNLRDWLLERVQVDDKITLHMGKTLTSIDDADQSFVTVHCEEGDFRGDMLIGADGVHSKVRSLLGLSGSVSSGARVWRGSADAGDEPLLVPLLEKGLAPLGIKNWGNGTFAIFNHHPVLPKRLNWVVTSKDPSVVPDVTTPVDLAEPHNDPDKPIYLKLWEKSLDHELTKSYDLATVKLPSEMGSGWGGRGRVTLIGDSAHAIRPAGGQGTAMAFEDCAVLRRKVKAFLQDGGDKMSRMECEELIRDFENERLERLRRISDHEHAVAEASYKGETVPMPEGYKEWLFAGV